MLLSSMLAFQRASRTVSVLSDPSTFVNHSDMQSELELVSGMDFGLGLDSGLGSKAQSNDREGWETNQQN